MNLDVKTLVIIVALVYTVLAIAIYGQYRINESGEGIGWWLLGTLLMAIGYIFMPLVRVESLLFLAMLSNPLIVLGYILLYIGALRFLSVKIHIWVPLTLYVVYIVTYGYFLTDRSAITQRTIVGVVIHIILTFMLAGVFHTKKEKAISKSVHFIVLIFILNGIYLIARLIFVLILPDVTAYNNQSLNYQLAFVIPIINGILWTFGFIIMVNQRLSVKHLEEKEKFQRVFNTSPDAEIVSRVEDGNIVDVNHGFTIISGYTHDEVIGKTTTEINIWHQKLDRDRFVGILREQGLCDNLLFEFERKDKTVFSGQISARTITIDSEIHIVSVVKDITLQMIAEKALRESEATYRSILDASPDDITITDLNGTIIMLSGAARRMFGYEKADGIGMNIMQFIHPDDHDRARVNINLMFQGKSKGLNEYRAIHKDHSIFDIEVNSSVILNAENEPFRMVFVARDITERKKKDQQIYELIEQLENERNLAQINAVTDSLTGLANRRVIDESLAIEIARIKRTKAPLSLIMIDVDLFKNYNDLYGHIAGDMCLKTISSTIDRIVTRKPDIVARYGGEEFIVILPATTALGATRLAELIRQEIEALSIIHEDSIVSNVVTISLGVVTVQQDQVDNPEQMLDLVDVALYKAKEAGRNQVQTYDFKSDDISKKCE